MNRQFWSIDHTAGLILVMSNVILLEYRLAGHSPADLTARYLLSHLTFAHSASCWHRAAAQMKTGSSRKFFDV